MSDSAASPKRNLRAAGIGRRKGTPNKLTRSAKQAMELAFEELGGVAGLVKWARTHQTSFYRLYGRLIPPGSGNGGPLVSINLPANGGPPMTPEQAYRFMIEGLIPLDPQHEAFQSARPVIEAPETAT